MKKRQEIIYPERVPMKKFYCTRIGCIFNKTEVKTGKTYCEHPKPDRETKDGFACFSFEPDNGRREGNGEI